MCGSARTGAPLAFVEMLLLLGAVYHAAAEEHAEEPVVVSFEQMNGSKLVELVVTRLFLYHH